jgi:hypothetical protein
LEPILAYTTELKYEESPGKYAKIYESLNRYLRENTLLTLDEVSVSKEWRYAYASTLLRHLRRI